jgi:hypothetical protein
MKEQTVAAFLDISRAYDNVILWHSIWGHGWTRATNPYNPFVVEPTVEEEIGVLCRVKNSLKNPAMSP